MILAIRKKVLGTEHPDTVISLREGEKIVVADTPQAVADKVRQCRAEAISLAMMLVQETENARPVSTSKISM